MASEAQSHLKAEQVRRFAKAWKFNLFCFPMAGTGLASSSPFRMDS